MKEIINSLPQDPEERKRFLADNALKVESGQYFKKYTAEEMVEAKDRLTEQVVHLKTEQEDFAEIKAGWMRNLKAYKAEVDSMTEIVKHGGEHVHGELFLFDDQEAGMMYTFNAGGDLISERRLHPSERQTRLNAMSRVS